MAFRLRDLFLWQSRRGAQLKVGRNDMFHNCPRSGYTANYKAGNVTSVVLRTKSMIFDLLMNVMSVDLLIKSLKTAILIKVISV